MLIIRDAQQHVFKMDAQQRFESEAVAFVAACWPEHHAELGEEGTRQRVREAMAHAAAWGITDQRDVLRFINVTLALGPGFAQDARTAWARHILQDRSLTPAGRVKVLCEETARRLKRAEEAQSDARE